MAHRRRDAAGRPARARHGEGGAGPRRQAM